jgi:uncharacterized membrane-anchored protein YhcB (DUF1043 family)
MFRFTIRDALWLTVVVGLGVGWQIDRRMNSELNSDREKLRHELAETKAELTARKESLDSLLVENAQLEGQLRKRRLLNEAQPGTYFLGPLRPASPPGRNVRTNSP